MSAFHEEPAEPGPRRRLSPTHRRLIIVAVVVVAAAIGATVFAVTRSGGSSPTANRFNGGRQPNFRGYGNGQNGPNGQAFQKFQQCLQQHGVTMTPGQRPDFNDSKLQAAFQACRKYMPQRPGGFQGGGGPPGGFPGGGNPNGSGANT